MSDDEMGLSDDDGFKPCAIHLTSPFFSFPL